MKRDSVIDYWGCILFKIAGPLIRALGESWAMFLGRRLGDLFYLLDVKHRSIAYSNLKVAFGRVLSLQALCALTRRFYQTYGQNFLEIFFIPRINPEYIKKYVTIEGLDYVREALSHGKGVILLGIHEGSWELSNIIAINAGLPFAVFVRGQRYPRLNRLLNAYRIKRGCRIIPRESGIEGLIQALKENRVVGMTLDQGGKSGVGREFFGKTASLSSGAVKLALKYETKIIPAFFVRIKGPYFKIILGPPYTLERRLDKEEEIRLNLAGLASIFENYLKQYPQEYLWTYRIWKYSQERKILILSDAKAGHLGQSEAVSEIARKYWQEKNIKSEGETLEIKFKNRFAKTGLALSSMLAGKYYCQGCLWCLRTFLEEDIYKRLIQIKPDLIISCGASLAAVNFVLARENLAKSICIMRPGTLSLRRFDLVVMPRHDRPPRRKNVAVSEGALSLCRVAETKDLKLEKTAVGLLIGGKTRNFTLRPEAVLETIRQIKAFAQKYNLEILATTSRRTPAEIEELVKKELRDYPACKLLIIANEKNIPAAIAKILTASRWVVASAESISMISEAASSGRYIFVFSAEKLDRKHQRFLEHFARKKYIYLTKPARLSEKMAEIEERKPEIQVLKDAAVVRQAIEKIL